jgi:hypothetical protein
MKEIRALALLLKVRLDTLHTDLGGMNHHFPPKATKINRCLDIHKDHLPAVIGPQLGVQDLLLSMESSQHTVKTFAFAGLLMQI